MIEYDPKSWVSVVTRLRGSILLRLIPRMLICAALGVAAVMLFRNEGTHLPSQAHTLVGVALGLLLVFRTNASYDRYWEGRRLLGAIVNRSRDLARQLLGVDPAARAILGRQVPAFYWLATQALRRQTDLTALGDRLTAEERAALASVANRAPVMVAWIGARIRAEVSAGRLSETQALLIDQNLTALNDSLGGAERILKTPIPFAYAQHIKIFVVLFCFSVPFAIVDVMGWSTPVVSAVLALALFGVDEIGVEIEDPFGDDPNDLPLDAIGGGIDRAVAEILATSAPTSSPA
jgi:putative membrane protein